MSTRSKTNDITIQSKDGLAPADGPDPLGSTWIGPAHVGKRMDPEAAILALADADHDRAIADAMEPFSTAEADLKRIKAMDQEQKALLSLEPSFWPGRDAPKVGNGGELVQDHFDVADSFAIIDTVTQSPDLLTTKASCDRLKLSSETDSLSLAVDAAQSVKARNSIEKMLVQQMAAMHRNGMQLAAKVNQEIQRISTLGMLPAQRQVASVEAARLTGAAARAFTSYQDGMLALQRVRTGGKQKVIVTHIHQYVAVGEGGKAVVAGNLKAKGRGSKRRGVKPK